MSIINLDALPADPLLGLMAAFRDDPRPAKIDLGVGVYRDEHGKTPVMQAVKDAELLLCENAQTKAYEGPRGNIGFCTALQKLIFADNVPMLEERLTSLVTPGGCGALYLGLQFAKRVCEAPTVWISTPSWPNHRHIAHSAGLAVAPYRYLNTQKDDIAFAQMYDDLQKAKRGDIVILQGPCHNPSGIDLTKEQWRSIAQLAGKTGFIPFIDIAYHGLGAGLEEDFIDVQAIFTPLPEVMISYSCSKNFGLYRERTGCFLLLAATHKKAQAATTHLADIARACYSMPPAHGAAIVETILCNAALRQEWETELSAMRDRLMQLRVQLAQELVKTFEDPAFDRIITEKGMFSLLPITPDIADMLAKSYGIYVPGSGRINIAGLTRGNVRAVATALHATTQPV